MMDLTETHANPNLLRRELDTNKAFSRTVPIVQVPNILNSAPEEPNKIACQSSSIMVPLGRMIPETETNGVLDQTANGDQTQTKSLNGLSTTGVASTSQPKVVQTAFIHKLYNMLEDQSIQHLISWSKTAESFVMSPSNDFSKLNMYGFHKVSDVFHTGSPESPLWEFKHGNGNFKRGDLVGLREIKRRASRHALVHRDSYSGPKPSLPQHGPSMESINSHPASTHDSTESRLTNLEQTTYELHALLQKSEENSNLLQTRNQIISEALSRSLQINHEISRIVLSMVPNSNIPIHRDVVNVQAEIQRQAEALRSLDEHSDPQIAASRSLLPNISLENGSLSPRQKPQEDSRRGPVLNLSARNNYYHRPPVPSLFGATHSLNANNSHSSPSSLRSQAPTYPSHSHPLSNSIPHLSPPTNLARRHTSADIRNVNGWQSSLHSLGSAHVSSQWPSPRCDPTATNEEQHIRDSFSSYSLTAASSSRLRTEGSRPTTPPPSFTCPPADHNTSYPWVNGREKPGSMLKETSAPQICRGNMAHILNPTEMTDVREDHDENAREDDRKRKRI